MKHIFLIVFLIFGNAFAEAQDLAVQTFGKKTDPPLIFFHGGPGYNSVPFERTTGEKLSAEGFFVISYDRRGEGRSDQVKAAYTFEESFEDILKLYEQFNLEKASLLGHSFGGVVASLFAEKYPSKVKDLWLVGAPVSLQQTLKTIIRSSKEIYISQKDSVNLNYIKMLENMDAKSLEYSSYAFVHAMQNGFYMSKNLTEEAKELYGLFRTDPQLKTYGSKMDYSSPRGFWQNEHYTSVELAESLAFLKAQKIPIYGMYGKEDGLFSAAQIADLKTLIGAKNVFYLDRCSHNVFIDQQTSFISLLKEHAL